MEQIWNTLKQGLKTYCSENGFTDVSLGLSGGMDSALVAVLAADTLGGDHVHTLMMKTKYTSQDSLNIAQELSRLNHFHYRELDIQPTIDSEIEFLQKAFMQEPIGNVLENLQARERGKILMAFSNQFNWLLLACNNKSEGAMGYCTLYGDLCGGLSPIGDVYKTMIYDLAKWRNTQSYVFPEKVLTRAPSAELAEDQKDEDSLPPYLILDAILKLYIDEKKSEDDIVAKGFDRKTIAWIIKRYHLTAFKRNQMAPAIRI